MTLANRRNFLRFLAASPLFSRAFAQSPATPKEVLEVMDLEPLAHGKLPPAHWGYMSSGVDDDFTLRANLAAFKRIRLKPRKLVNVASIDTRVQVFGSTWESPMYLSAVGGHRMFHPDGELATARAARSRKTTQMLSTQASIGVEDVAQALGAAPWYQLYIPQRWDQTEKLIRRVEEAGCPVVAWTIDGLGGRNIETSNRLARTDTRNCASCHENRVKPMLVGIEGGLNPSSATWEWVDRLKKMTRMKVVLKGLDNAADAKLAVEHGVDGIVVSNHGGRATETLRASVECLPEVIEAVGGRIPVFVDGGIRRGTDIYKALALGARAVGLGRAYIYGLTAFGQEGIERVLDILNAELQMTMRQCGAPSIGQIKRTDVVV